MLNNEMYITVSQGNKVSFRHNEWFLNFVISNLRGESRKQFHCTNKQLEVFEKNTKDIHGARHNEKFWISFDNRYFIQVCRNLVTIKDLFKEEIENLKIQIENLKEEVKISEIDFKNGKSEAQEWILEDKEEIKNLEIQIKNLQEKM